jgi:hypothetical protein
LYSVLFRKPNELNILLFTTGPIKSLDDSASLVLVITNGDVGSNTEMPRFGLRQVVVEDVSEVIVRV